MKIIKTETFNAKAIGDILDDKYVIDIDNVEITIIEDPFFPYYESYLKQKFIRDYIAVHFQ